MQLRVTSELVYDVIMPSTFIFNIQVANYTHQKILSETVSITPNLLTEAFSSHENSNRYLGLRVDEPQTFSIKYQAIIDISITTFKIKNEWQPAIPLGSSVFPYLFPSRYCESDKLQKFAFKEFGNIVNRYEQVLAINEWIYKNIEYLNGSTNSFTSALNTISERSGVCRDFAHLGIALCRALSIPARYCTVYAYQLFPQDFHACFEAYIGNRWIIFDATKLVPMNAMVIINRSHDAATASFANIFGQAFCQSIFVNCQLHINEQNFNAINYGANTTILVAYE
ncbi:MAG: transglutaminase-like domain-containing protein [Chitinophagaceae bacterium]